MGDITREFNLGMIDKEPTQKGVGFEFPKLNIVKVKSGLLGSGEKQVYQIKVANASGNKFTINIENISHGERTATLINNLISSLINKTKGNFSDNELKIELKKVVNESFIHERGKKSEGGIEREIIEISEISKPLLSKVSQKLGFQKPVERDMPSAFILGLATEEEIKAFDKIKKGLAEISKMREDYNKIDIPAEKQVGDFVTDDQDVVTTNQLNAERTEEKNKLQRNIDSKRREIESQISALKGKNSGNTEKNNELDQLALSLVKLATI